MFNLSFPKFPSKTAAGVMSIFHKTIKELEEVIALHKDHSAKQNDIAVAARQAAEASDLEVLTARQHIDGLTALMTGDAPTVKATEATPADAAPVETPVTEAAPVVTEEVAAPATETPATPAQ